MEKNKNAQEKTNEIVIKNETPKHFIIIYESVYKNTNLTADEIALIVKLLSIAPNFSPTYEKLQTILHIGKKALTKAVKGLTEKGYLRVKKIGIKSEWIISQEPFIKFMKDLSDETLLNALIDYQITLRDLKRLHYLKHIDDKQLIRVKDAYIKYLKKIVKTDWLNTDNYY